MQQAQKHNKILSNVHNIESAHRQCVKKHYAKFEYKGIKTVGAKGLSLTEQLQQI